MNDFLASIELQYGKHSRNVNLYCAMEAAAILSGEEKSDAPKCVSPIYAAVFRIANDALTHVSRQRLKKYLPKLLGTNDGSEDRRLFNLVASTYGVYGFNVSDYEDLKEFVYDDSGVMAWSELLYETITTFRESLRPCRAEVEGLASILVRFMHYGPNGTEGILTILDEVLGD